MERKRKRREEKRKRERRGGGGKDGRGEEGGKEEGEKERRSGGSISQARDQFCGRQLPAQHSRGGHSSIPYGQCTHLRYSHLLFSETEYSLTCRRVEHCPWAASLLVSCLSCHLRLVTLCLLCSAALGRAKQRPQSCACAALGFVQRKMFPEKCISHVVLTVSILTAGKFFIVGKKLHSKGFSV